MRFWGKLAAAALFATISGGYADDNKKSFSDGNFVDQASTIGRAEVVAGQIAVQRASHENVKKFAARMIEDHSKANNDLLIIVSDERIPIPDRLTADQEKALNHLNGESLKDFDKEYMKHMVEGHEKAVELFGKAAKECKDAKLKAFAEKTLPTIKEHLSMAKKVKDELK